MINFDYRQRINLFSLTNAVQSLLILKKNKIGHGKCITMIKYLGKTVLCALCWNDKVISKRRLQLSKELILNEINEGLLNAVHNLRYV